MTIPNNKPAEIPTPKTNEHTHDARCFSDFEKVVHAEVSKRLERNFIAATAQLEEKQAVIDRAVEVDAAATAQLNTERARYESQEGTIESLRAQLAALEEQAANDKAKFQNAHSAVCKIKQLVESSDDFSADEVIELCKSVTGKFAISADWVRSKVIEEMTEEAKEMSSRLVALQECNRGLREALERIRSGVPACSQDGCLYIAHFDQDGTETGIEHVDPLAVIQSIVGLVDSAFAKTPASVSDDLAALRKDRERLEWICEYLTANGLNGFESIAWTVLDEDGKSLMHRETISEDEVGDVRFDRAAIDLARTQEKHP